MLKSLATRFLQHVTDQNNWSRKHLIPFADNILQFDIALVKTNLVILKDGSLRIASATAKPDAVIRISPSLALRLLAKDKAAKMDIQIEGDTHLATAVSKVLQLMRWDIEEDLSKIMGDIPANQLTKVGQKLAGEIKKQSINVAEMLTEYWQEEKVILAKARHISQFNQQVDNLRSDTDRLGKRIEKLTKQLKESNI